MEYLVFCDPTIIVCFLIDVLQEQTSKEEFYTPPPSVEEGVFHDPVRVR